MSKPGVDTIRLDFQKASKTHYEPHQSFDGKPFGVHCVACGPDFHRETNFETIFAQERVDAFFSFVCGLDWVTASDVARAFQEGQILLPAASFPSRRNTDP